MRLRVISFLQLPFFLEPVVQQPLLPGLRQSLLLLYHSFLIFFFVPGLLFLQLDLSRLFLGKKLLAQLCLGDVLEQNVLLLAFNLLCIFKYLLLQLLFLLSLYFCHCVLPLSGLFKLLSLDGSLLLPLHQHLPLVQNHIFSLFFCRLYL